MRQYRPTIVVLGALSANTQPEVDANIWLVDKVCRELVAKGWAPINFHTMYRGWEIHTDYDTMMSITTSVVRSLGSAGIPCCFVENWPFSNGACEEHDICESLNIVHWESKEVPDAADWIRDDVICASIRDQLQRRAIGVKTYGEALRPYNGRNSLQDAYEEVLDLAHYLKQTMLEQSSVA